MVVSVALLIIYSLVMIFHLVGMTMCSIVLIDVDLNVQKMTQILFAFTFVLPLVVSDILSICYLSKRISVDLREAIYYLDAFAAFIYVSLFVHISNNKLLMLVKGVSKECHDILFRILLGIIFLSISSFFGGLNLCGVDYDITIPYFLTAYFCAFSFLNLIFVLISTYKISGLNATARTSSNFAVSMRRTTTNARAPASSYGNMSSNDIDDPKPSANPSASSLSRLGEALSSEVKLSYRSGLVTSAFAITFSVILLCVFDDPSSVYSDNMSVPIAWKISAGFSCVYLPYVHLVGK